MTPYLLLYPAFDHSKTNARMTDPKVVHPATQNRIDFRNHNLYGPSDMLTEDLPELFKQRCPLLQLGRIVGPPLLPKAEYAPILKTQESKTLSLFQIHHPTLVRVDLNAELRELLAQPSVYRLHQPVTPPFSVDQDHHIVRKRKLTGWYQDELLPLLNQMQMLLSQRGELHALVSEDSSLANELEQLSGITEPR